MQIENMSEQLSAAKNLFCEKSASCAIANGNESVAMYEHGILPLINALDKNLLCGASVADKIIGKSAAFILIKGGAREVYAKLISEHAMKILDAHGIKYFYEESAPFIINRGGNGICPMEKTVLDIDDTDAAVKALREKISEMRGK